MKRRLVYALLMASALCTMVGCGKTESQLSELNNTKTAEQLQQEASGTEEGASTDASASEEDTEQEGTEAEDTSEEDSKGTEESNEEAEDSEGNTEGEEDEAMDLDELSAFDDMDSGDTDGKDSTELAARRAVENGIECGLPELKVILPKYLVDHVSTKTILDTVKNPKPYQGTFVAYGAKKCSPIKMVALMKYSDTALRNAGYIGTSLSVYDNYSTVSSPVEKSDMGMQKINFMDTIDFEKPSLMTSAGKTWLNKAYKSAKNWKKNMKGVIYSTKKNDITYDVLFLYASKNEEDAKAQMELIMDSVYFVD